MRNIRVGLADDHAVLRAGLRVLIDTEPDLEVVGEAASVSAAEELVVALGPDVLVLDLNMPGGNTLSLIQQTRSAHPDTRVLVLTMHDEPAYASVVLGAGASGYVVKTADAREVLAAIRAVHQGRTFLDIGQGGSLAPPPPAAVPEPSPEERLADPLSERERQVLQFLADGYTNKEIASRLDLSVKTVETYRMRAMQKLGLRSRADVVRYIRGG